MKIYTVFEFGATKITALSVEKSPKGLVPLAFISKKVDCFKNGLITNPTVFLSTIKEIRDYLDTKLLRPIESISISISGLNTKSTLKMNSQIFSEPTTVKKDTIISLLQKQQDEISDKVLHCFPMRYKLDERTDIESPEGLIANEIGVASHIVSIPTDIFEMYESLLKKIGLKIENFVSLPYAISLSALSNRQKKEGVLLIDIGEKNSQLSLWKNRTPFFMSSLPLGGDLITKDIESIFRISREEAVESKETFGRAWVLPEDHLKNILIAGKTRSLLDLTQVIHTRAKETFELIKAFLESKTNLETVKEIVITGGGSKIPYMRELVYNIFHRPVSVAREVKWKEHIISTALYGLILNKHGLKKTSPEKEAETKTLVSKLRNWVDDYL